MFFFSKKIENLETYQHKKNQFKNLKILKWSN